MIITTLPPVAAANIETVKVLLSAFLIIIKPRISALLGFKGERI